MLALRGLFILLSRLIRSDHVFEGREEVQLIRYIPLTALQPLLHILRFHADGLLDDTNAGTGKVLSRWAQFGCRLESLANSEMEGAIALSVHEHHMAKMTYHLTLPEVTDAIYTFADSSLRRDSISHSQ